MKATRGGRPARAGEKEEEEETDEEEEQQQLHLRSESRKA